MPTNLAPVYLDDARVQLQGDPRPRVSKIVAAGGKSADGDLVVLRLRSQADTEGNPVRLEDVIDRAQQSEPVYLRSRPGAEGKPSFAADESTGVGGTMTQIEAGGAGQGDRLDPMSSIGNRVRAGTGSPRSQPGTKGEEQGTDFGAARRGIAGQGAKDSPGDVPADKKAKSDAGTASASDDLDERSGASDRTYGAGDLQPGGRVGLQGKGPRPSHGNPDSTQEFQSGGRQGEGMPGAHAGQGGSSRRQAGRRPASAARDGTQDAQAGGLRDQSTDRTGRQQGQGAPTSASREGDGPTASDAD